MTPGAVRLDLCTKAYETCKAALLGSGWPGAGEGVEPWFDFPFVQAQLPADVLRSWAAAAPSPDIALPPRNDYLPTDFELRCEAAGAAADGPAAAAAAQQQNGGANGKQADGGAAAAAVPSGFPTPPALLLDEPGLRIWHKLDSTFRQVGPFAACCACS